MITILRGLIILEGLDLYMKPHYTQSSIKAAHYTSGKATESNTTPRYTLLYCYYSLLSTKYCVHSFLFHNPSLEINDILSTNYCVTS